MGRIRRRWTMLGCACLVNILISDSALAQQHTLAFSSVDSPNANWYIAKERALYKKYGLDVELIYIPSSTTTISAVVAGSVAIGNISAERLPTPRWVAPAWLRSAALSIRCPIS